MVEDDQTTAHGAGRITEHALLAPLQTAAIESFFFDGVEVEGRVGEPIAAALLAAGQRIFRTMPEYGDPRGGYCMVGRCSDCLVVVNGVPGVRACMSPVTGGLHVQTQYGLGEFHGDEPDWLQG